jgi:hypothetical protein
MDEMYLKEIIKKAESAVEDIKDESLKKIAFQKVLDTLLTPISAPPTQNYKQNEPTQVSRMQYNSKSPENFSELYHDKNPKTHPDIVLTIAYFMHFKDNNDFSISDIIENYKKILVPAPQNPTDIINQNIRKGYINKMDRKKESKQAYHITKKGIECVNSDFGGKAKPVTFNKKRNVKTKKDENNGENKG